MVFSPLSHSGGGVGGGSGTGGNENSASGGGSSSRPAIDFASLSAASSSLLSSSTTRFATPAVASTATTTSWGTANVSAAATNRIRKSIRELGVASDALGKSAAAAAAATTVGGTSSSSSSSLFGYELEASAHRLLARQGGGYDSALLHKRARELEQRTMDGPVRSDTGGGADATGPLFAAARSATRSSFSDKDSFLFYDLSPLDPDESLEERLQRHADRSLEYILTEQSRRLREEEIPRDMEAYLFQDWKADEAAFLNNVVGGKDHSARWIPGSHDAAAAAAATAAGFTATKRVGTTTTPSGLSQEAIDHVTILRDWNRKGAEAARQDLCDEYLALAAKNRGPYYVAWTLVQSILSAAPDNSAASRVRATLQWLANQQQRQVRHTIQSSALQGRPLASGLDGFANDVATFVEMELGGGAAAADPKSYLWRRVFYCLRCGDCTAAYRTLRAASSSSASSSTTLALTTGSNAGSMPDDEAVMAVAVRALAHLAGLQGDEGFSLFGNTTPLTLPAQLRREVADVYQRELDRRGTSTSSSYSASSSVGTYHVEHEEESYLLATLALLATIENSGDGSSSVVLRTIEDYIFRALWNAVFGTDGDLDSALAKLGEVFKSWGPSYFDGTNDSGRPSSSTDERDGWAYAFPLLLAQQYYAALHHLTVASPSRGLLQAVHLGLVLGDEALVDVTTTAATPAKRGLLAQMLSSHVRSFETLYPDAALEYMVRIPDDKDSSLPPLLSVKSSSRSRFVSHAARQQIRRLLLDTRSFDILAGKVANDDEFTASSSRTKRRGNGGALDAHFTDEEVSDILADAAQECLLRPDGSKEDAAELFHLAGRFSSLLALLNRELAVRLVVARDDGEKTKREEERQFWRNAAVQFHALHIAPSDGKSSGVLRALEEDGTLYLGQTFQLLLNLMVFFDHCQQGAWEDAWKIMSHLKLFPSEESEMTVRLEEYRALDLAVQQQFHHILLATMECLYQLYVVGKQSGRVAHAKFQARLLMVFGNQVSGESEEMAMVKSHMARMEAYMV